MNKKFYHVHLLKLRICTSIGKFCIHTIHVYWIYYCLNKMQNLTKRYNLFLSAMCMYTFNIFKYIFKIKFNCKRK